VESPAQFTRNIHSILFNHYLLPSLLVDPVTGKIVEMNHTAVRFLRLPADRIIGQSLRVLIPPDKSDFLDDMLETVRKHGQSQTIMELRVGRDKFVTAQFDAQSIDTSGGSLLLVTLQGSEGDSGETAVPPAELARMRHHLDGLSELCFGLNNPFQELLSMVELQGNVRLKRAAETASSILRRLRALEEGAMPARKAPKSNPAPAIPYGSPCTKDAVLIIDDDLNIRNLFNNILCQSFPDIHFDLAGDGPAALEAKRLSLSLRAERPGSVEDKFCEAIQGPTTRAVQNWIASHPGVVDYGRAVSSR